MIKTGLKGLIGGGVGAERKESVSHDVRGTGSVSSVGFGFGFPIQHVARVCSVIPRILLVFMRT